MAIAELLPHTEVVGGELNKRRLSEADAILEHRALANARFMRSRSGEQLPAGIGSFDFVMLSAVFEHLLPAERDMVMPLLWSHMRPGAVMFVNQTPHRWHPYEHHSTRLWGINYLPDTLAERLASLVRPGPSHLRSSSSGAQGGPGLLAHLSVIARRSVEMSSAATRPPCDATSVVRSPSLHPRSRMRAPRPH
jgi:hypothetical protein